MKKTDFKSKMDPSDEVRHLRSECKRLETQYQQARNISGQIDVAMAALMDAVVAIQPEQPLYTEPVIDAKVESPVTHVQHCTDWHIGQFTDPAGISGFGEMNHEIAKARVENFAEMCNNKVLIQRQAYRIKKLHIIGTADWVSGDIHPELVATNEFPAPRQAVEAGYLLAKLVALQAPYYPEVQVDVLTNDNHGRITRKPQAEDGAVNNWSYVTAHIAKLACRDLPNVTVNIHPSLSFLVSVEQEKYLCLHGHGIIGTWGIPFYGIERQKMREAMARMNIPDTQYTKIILGHFHTSLNHPDWQIGGSLSGTSAYDHSQGRYSPAHQTSWWVHPKRGEFDWCRWWL